MYKAKKKWVVVPIVLLILLGAITAFNFNVKETSVVLAINTTKKMLYPS